MALPKKLIDNPMQKMKKLAINQPQTRPAGPEAIPILNTEAILGRRPIIENAIPKTCMVE